MDPWTPADRNAFIDYAVNSKDNKGQRGPYQFATYPKLNGVEQEDPKRALVTEALAKAIYQSNPAFRAISVAFFHTLMQKLSMNQFTGPAIGRDVVVSLKGGNAYAYVTNESFPEDFPFSDLDIVVYINPYLPADHFDHLAHAVKITVLQTISQYKRTLDHMFFVNKPIEDQILDAETIQAFKEAHKKILSEIDLPDGAEFVSPFASDEVRNYCSRHSFLLTNSLAKENSVKKVEVPHFERCERIPLRRTPFFSSYNDTIDFQRDNADLKGRFDLYRIRFNNMYIEKDEEGGVIHEERVTADFIDVSIAAKDDAELLDFWNKGRCMYVLDRPSNVWVMVPDIMSCIEDLRKMLFVYDCPEAKKAKRLVKYEKLQQLLR
jgi:hypothetical protein